MKTILRKKTILSMRNIILVARNAISTTLRKRLFWFMTFFLPAILLAFQVYASVKNNSSQSNSTTQAEQVKPASPAELTGIGLVDEGSLLATPIIQHMLPVEILPDNPFILYPDSAKARTALQNKQILQYVIIPADYLVTGQVKVYAMNFQLSIVGEGMGVAMNGSDAWKLEYLINYNLTGDVNLVNALHNPTPGMLAEYHAIQPPPSTDANTQAAALLVSQVLPYLFYFILLFSSSYLLQSVTAEKENRTAEVLLTSIEPRQLMTGKVLGLGVITLLQLLVWLAGGFFAMQRSPIFTAVSNLQFSPGFFAWAVLYLFLGYLVFGSIMAAGGALSPNAREGGNLIWILVVPLMPTLMFGPEFVENPNGALALGLSLFPLCSPSAMVTRLAITQVPLWQLLLSLGLLVVTAYLVISLAGRFFRADNLLSGASFKWDRLAKGWRAESGK